MAVPALLVPFMVIYYILEAFVRLFVPRKRKEIRGQTVLITGAAGGLGTAFARQFHAEGCRLVLWDIAEDGVRRLANEITEQGGTAFYYTCDVTDKQQVKSVANQVRRDAGHVDILVNNAGIMLGGEILQLTESMIRKTMEVNLISHFWTLQEFVPYMIEQNRGHIVTISSMAGIAGVPLMSEYCASKFAVRGMTMALQEEFRRSGKTGIDTISVCPFFVNTNLIHNEDLNNRMRWTAGKEKVLQPTDVAEAVVNGVRDRVRTLYLPKVMKAVPLLSLILPQKALQMLADQDKIGFYVKAPDQSSYAK